MKNFSDKPIELFPEDIGPKIGKKTLKGSTYPYMVFEGDTWRKQTFFREAVNRLKEDDEEGLWTVIKKVWIDFNISIRPERVRMRKQGRLTPEHMLSLAEDSCPCCGNVMWYGRVHNMVEGYRKPSLDRLDPEGGYIDQNIWIICNTCNTRKNNARRPIELLRIGLAWKKQEDKLLKKDREEYTKYFPNLDNFFID
tara:strand:- start:76 stop:663 length:588 start_codon:yes stop_codon:yes gene_type:complete